MHPLSIFRFCPVCGSGHFEENNFKSKRCADCGFVYYFNPSSATVAVILNSRNEILVCRRGKEPAMGSLDLPGGFVDCGETSEEGMLREIEEETALSVTPPRYLFSLPNTYMYSGLMVHTLDSFYLLHTTGDETPKAMDDVAESFWLHVEHLNPDEFGLNSIRKAVARIKQSLVDGEWREG